MQLCAYAILHIKGIAMHNCTIWHNLTVAGSVFPPPRRGDTEPCNWTAQLDKWRGELLLPGEKWAWVWGLWVGMGVLVVWGLWVGMGREPSGQAGQPAQCLHVWLPALQQEAAGGSI